MPLGDRMCKYAMKKPTVMESPVAYCHNITLLNYILKASDIQADTQLSFNI